MIIFLYGSDGYRLRQNRQTVINQYRAKHSSGLNLFFFDAAEPKTASQINDAFKTNSFFDEMKLVVADNVFADSEQAEKLIEILETQKIAQDKKQVILAVHPGSASEAKPKAVFDFLNQKPHLVREFKPLEGAKLEQWIKSEALARNVAFVQGALKTFMLLAGNDNHARINNLEKLANYCQGPVTIEAINQLVKSSSESNIFDFLDAVGSGNRAKSIELLYTELENGRDPYYLISMLAYQYRTMLAVKDGGAKSGVHPFVARKLAPVLAKYSIDQLKNKFQDLADLEIKSKNGLIDLKDSLYTFVLH